MPARLSQLATLFETIIFKYYGPRPKDLTHTPVSSEQTDVDEFIQVDLESVGMEGYILAAAARKKSFDRVPLMNYIAYGIKLINTVLASSKPLDEQASNELKQQLNQMIMDLRSVLAESKTVQVTVNYNDDTVMINGCCGCASGIIIQDVLFSNLKNLGRDDGVYITDIVNAHQSPLLIQANLHLTAELLKQSKASQDLVQEHRVENLRLTTELSKQSKASQDLVQKHRVEIETMRNLNGENRRSLRPVQSQTTQLASQAPLVPKRGPFLLFPQIIEDLFAGNRVENPSPNDFSDFNPYM